MALLRVAHRRRWAHFPQLSPCACSSPRGARASWGRLSWVTLQVETPVGSSPAPPPGLDPNCQPAASALLQTPPGLSQSLRIPRSLFSLCSEGDYFCRALLPTPSSLPLLIAILMKFSIFKNRDSCCAVSPPFSFLLSPSIPPRLPSSLPQTSLPLLPACFSLPAPLDVFYPSVLQRGGGDSS